jgi:ribonuclease R
MELRDRLLSLLDEGGKPVTVRELMRELDLDREGRRDAKAALRKLLEDGEVVKIRGGRIGLPSRMNLIVGRLTCNPAGFGFVVPEGRRRGRGDIYVSAVNMKEALHGDRVVARIERVTPKRPSSS